MATEIIKVCGITQPADALNAVQAGATAIGMVFYGPSPRFVRIHEAAMISAVVPSPVLKVGVFVNESAEQIRAIAGAVRLDVIQLHGDDGPEICAELSDLRVWKAVRVGEGFDASALQAYRAEAYLLDAPAGESYGGTGRTFPWPYALEAKRYGKIIVAGGLGPDNVAEAIRQVDPWGVDASSKLESKPGIKDPEAVRRYVEAAKSVK